MKYWRASRPYSYTAALVPVAISSALAVRQFPDLHFDWLNFVLCLIGCMGAQAVSNLANDLADVKYGLDKPGAPGRYHGITSGDSSWGEILVLTLIIGFVSLVVGVVLAARCGWPLLWLILISAFLAVEYTAPPLKLKYRALGDITVFLTFGLAMNFGAYYVQTHAQPEVWSTKNILVLLAGAVPSAIHCVAILQGNNHRDRDKDIAAGARTIANLLPFRVSKGLLIFELVAPYALVVIAVFCKWLPVWALLAFLTIPALLAILGPIRKDEYRGTVPATAKLHGAFGGLIALGLVASLFFR